MVTLVGTGGIGKTRCAVQVAAGAAARFEHGVRLVELASVADPHLVANAVAAAFDVPLSGGEPAVETLARALQSRNVLVVLDNCEHVVAEVAPVVDRLLRHCADATVFATSREPLNLRGESVYRLPSLSVPPERTPRTAAEAMTYGAVALFVHRATAARPEFVLDDGNVAAVSAICRRLDGIALAIELAAIRLRAIGVDDLLERLNRRFRLLKSGSRTDLPRQQTMRALVDWSYDLLGEAERRTFRRLSVFANRFDLDGALDVCAGDDADDDALDQLESLVDKSLVAVDRDDRDGERPYRLLETLREYAHEKLVESGEEDATYARLARRCIARATASDAGWVRSASAAWRRAFETDLDDMRAVLAWSLERRRDVALGIELAAASRRGWSSVAPAEGRSWMLTARDALDENAPPRAAARVWLAVAHVHVALGQHASALEAARRAAEMFGDEASAERFEADSFAGFSLALLGELSAAKELLEPALAAFESMGLEHLAAVAATDLAAAHVYAEDFDDARRLFREALARFRRFDDDGGLDAVTINLSELEFRSGDAETAIRLTADAIADRADDAPILMLANMAAYLCAIDRFDEARAYARDALARAEATGQDVDVAFSIQHLAAIASLETRPGTPGSGATLDCAARLLGFVDAALVTLASAREFTERCEYDRARAALVAGIGRDAVETALRDGATQSRRLAIAEATRL